MLVLSRKTGERIWIGNNISIVVVRIGPASVRIGIDAPKDVSIVREELREFTGDGDVRNVGLNLDIS